MNAAHYQEEAFRETAGTLGRSGRRVEEALGKLREAELPSEERDRRLKAAVEAVYYFFIQRELLGSPNHAEAIALYDIPDEVLKRLGSI
jgi:hypothetical protein